MFVNHFFICNCNNLSKCIVSNIIKNSLKYRLTYKKDNIIVISNNNFNNQDTIVSKCARFRGMPNGPNGPNGPIGRQNGPIGPNRPPEWSELTAWPSG